MTSSRELTIEAIDVGLDMLGAAFNRRISEDTRRLWHNMFDGEAPLIIGKAFQEICNNDDKMPSPKRMCEAVLLFKPSRMNSPTYTPGFDKDGVPCVFWSDEPNIPAYSAENCAAGREALATLHRIAGHVEMPGSTQSVAARKRELQAQKVALHKQGKL